MTKEERRRYFRINETVGISYQCVDADTIASKAESSAPDILDLVSGYDEQIERLLIEVQYTQPKVAELLTIFNQKVERVVNHLIMESQLVNRIAHRVREANISACGIAFQNEESVRIGERLRLELTLYPDEQKIATKGRVVSCDLAEDEKSYYWRVDFYGMRPGAQEKLIQHIVKSQGSQLKSQRKA